MIGELFFSSLCKIPKSLTLHPVRLVTWLPVTFVTLHKVQAFPPNFVVRKFSIKKQFFVRENPETVRLRKTYTP